MPINTNGNLWIYCLNIGQGDTTVVITPEGRVIIIDAVRAKKIVQLLSDLGFSDQETLEHVIVSHPHYDHYSGVTGLLNVYPVDNLTLTSIWRYEANVPGYNSIINTAVDKDITLSFLSGYTQIYPDDSPIIEPNTPLLELLGPSNQFVEDLYQAKKLDANHRSIIARLQWGRFRMVIAGDAQMETWANFDREQMLNDTCAVLRSAHHGSANGTQYERITALAPEVIVVSSDPDGKDELPDLIGSAVFLRFSNSSSQPLIAMTHNTGTIKLVVRPTGSYDVFFYGDDNYQNVALQNEQLLTTVNNPTDWKAQTLSRLGF